MFYNMFRPMGVIFRLNLGTYFTSLFLQCCFYHFAIGILHALQLEYENLLVLSVRITKGTLWPWTGYMWQVLSVELPPVGCGGGGFSSVCVLLSVAVLVFLPVSRLDFRVYSCV